MYSGKSGCRWRWYC